MNRAYSLLDLKAVDEERRILRGVATTPSVDKMDDIVEPDGAQFKLPIPFLWQHNHAQPVGHVTSATVKSSGIEVEIQLQKTDEPGQVKDRLDSAWQDIRLGLVRGLSIGFKPIETARIEGTYGVRFLKWLWMELSGVTIAANGDCSIQTIKSYDAEARAAAGVDTRSEDEAQAAPGHDAAKSDDPSPGHVVRLDDPARVRASPFVIQRIIHTR